MASTLGRRNQVRRERLSGSAAVGERAVSVDSESIALDARRQLFIGDEYGPCYRFSPSGRMLAAIRPPDASFPGARARTTSKTPVPGRRRQSPENPGKAAARTIRGSKARR
jgi:hypothetical protein